MKKSGSDIDDALNSLRTLFLSSLAVLALWFLAWPAAVINSSNSTRLAILRHGYC
jgi:hypothetical protein